MGEYNLVEMSVRIDRYESEIYEISLFLLTLDRYIFKD